MAKDEATVRFNAETREFQNSIKDLNSAMSTLRSEAKLNESEFRATGDSVSYLESKQKILEMQIEANSGKQEALNAELEIANAIYGEGSAKAEQLQRQLNYVEAQGNGFESQLSACTSELEAQTSAMGELNATIESQEQELENLKDQYASSVIESGRWSEESMQLAESISTLSQELSENKKSVEDAQSAANGLDETFEKAENGASQRFNGIYDIIKGSLATDAIKEIGSQALEMAEDFDESTAIIVEGTGASGDALRDLQQVAVDAFGAMKNADADLGDVSGVVAELNTRLGVVDDEARLLTDDFLKFSHHVDEDAVGAVDSVVDVMKRWNLETDNIPDLLDDMTTANQACKMSVGEMTKYLTDNSVQFQELGYDIEDSIGMMMGFSDGGANVSSVMMGMKQAVANLSSETEDVPGAFQEALDTIESCDSVSEALTKTVGDTGKTVQDVFGKRAAQEIATCVQSGNFDIERFTSMLRDNQGAMQDTAENATTMADEWSRATNNVAVAFDSTLAPMISDFVHMAADGAQGFADMDDETQKFVIGAGVALIAMKPLNSIWGKMLPQLKTMAAEMRMNAASLKGMTAAEKTYAVTTGAATKAAKGFKAALSTAAPMLAVTTILLVVDAIGKHLEAMEEEREHQEKLERSTRGLEDAASGLTVQLEEESDALGNVSDTASSIDLESIIQDHIDLADSISDLKRETATSVGELDGYRDTIDNLAGKKATAENMAELQSAIDGVNKSCGTSYTVTKNAAGALEVQADGAKVAKDAILKLIDAEELKIRKDAILQQKQDLFAQQKKDAEDAATAWGEVTAKQDEYDRALAALNSETDVSVLPQLKAELDAANASLEEAKGRYQEVTEAQGATQSAYNKTLEQEKLLNMATQEGATAFLKAAEGNEAFKANVQAAGVDLVGFTQSLQDMGFTAEDVANMSAEDTQKIARQWKQAADACGGDVDLMRFYIKNYNATPIIDKKGKISADATELVDAKGEIYKWNGTKLVNKKGKVVTEAKELQDAQGNFVKWDKTTLKPIKGEARADFSQIKSANDAISQFRSYPKNLGEKYATLKIYQVKETKTKKTKSARGGIFPNAAVQKHAGGGFFVNRPTTIGYSGDVEHIAGEEDLEYVGYGEGATVLPLTDPKMRPWARAVAQEMGSGAARPVAPPANNVNITMNITVRGSMDDAAIDTIARNVRRAARMGVR